MKVLWPGDGFIARGHYEHGVALKAAATGAEVGHSVRLSAQESM